MNRLVFGLGRSGLGVLRFLHSHGLSARYAADHINPQDHRIAEQLGFIEDSRPASENYDQVIVAPGIPINHPLLVALADSAQIIGEAELAFLESPTPLIGITGTAGKTSTTLFTTHILRSLGRNAIAGGNVDPPLVDVVDEAEVAVVELSSFQLERIMLFHPRVAVLLNLETDHLDRHGSLENYHRTKLRLLRNLDSQDALVYNAGEARILQAVQESTARRYPFEPRRSPRNTNLEAAYWAARAYLDNTGLLFSDGALKEACATAPQVPGRFEMVGHLDGLSCYDDSIATRTNAVKAALEAAPAPIAWILGGVDKGADLDVLRPVVANRVELVLAIGRDGERMARTFADLAEVLGIEATSGEAAMEKALATARERLSQGSVLLAPLAASFDQFANYRARGKAFREALVRLGGKAWIPSFS